MTKKDLVHDVMENDITISKDQAIKAVESVFKSMESSLVDGESIFYRGFGTIAVKVRKAKKARDISRGITIDVPETKKAVLKPSPYLTGLINA